MCLTITWIEIGDDFFVIVPRKNTLRDLEDLQYFMTLMKDDEDHMLVKILLDGMSSDTVTINALASVIPYDYTDIFSAARNNIKRYIKEFKLTIMNKHYEKYLGTDCPICYEKITDVKNITVTLCSHIFCRKCIKAYTKNTCPLCRQAMT